MRLKDVLYWKLQHQHIITVVRLWLFVILLAPFQLRAAGDTTIPVVINRIKSGLYYPRSVERFYQQNGCKLAWIAPDSVKTHAWDAMLLLDCVRQYGLNHQDYHPDLLLYPKLHKLTEKGGSGADKALFDILLTDAMIRFMNDLHYGKLNPVFTSIVVDKGVGFKADSVLSLALKSSDFLGDIDKTQPKSKLYIDLQDHMRLLVGQRSGDCYVIPQGLIRKMAINMERLRWITTTGKNVHLTLVVKEGTIIDYKDTNHLDKALERALYNEDQRPKSLFRLDQSMR